MLPRDAFFAPTEMVKASRAVGRVSAEFVTPHPPGIPALAAGELISEPIVGYLEEIVANGAFVEGAANPALGKFHVVRGRVSTGALHCARRQLRRVRAPG
jgi:arginine/lysine/ornithine decarboxylase